MRSLFTLTLIDPARANFDSPPEPDKDTREVSLRNAIWALTPTFRKLKRRGYSRQKLVELLAEQNTHVTLPSLKDYLGDKASKRPGSTSGGRTDASAGGRPRGQLAGGPEASSRPAAAPVTAYRLERRDGGNASSTTQTRHERRPMETKERKASEPATAAPAVTSPPATAPRLVVPTTSPSLPPPPPASRERSGGSQS